MMFIEYGPGLIFAEDDRKEIAEKILVLIGKELEPKYRIAQIIEDILEDTKQLVKYKSLDF